MGISLSQRPDPRPPTHTAPWPLTSHVRTWHPGTPYPSAYEHQRTLLDARPLCRLSTSHSLVSLSQSHCPLRSLPPCPLLQRRAYKIKEWTDTEDFLAQLARLSGKLLKGGDADLNTAARMVLYDWQRGKVPFFTLPPDHTDDAPGAAAGSGAEGGKGEGKEAAAAAGAGALPVPKELVTEEDAAREAGAKPEAAAAGAGAFGCRCKQNLCVV